MGPLQVDGETKHLGQVDPSTGYWVLKKKKNIDHFLPLDLVDKIQKKASSYVIAFIVWVYKVCVVFNLVLVDLVPLVLCFLIFE